MRYVLGIDLGTSYFKFGLFDRDGCARAISRMVVPKCSTAERCELPIPRFWETLRAGIRQAVGQAGVRTADIAALAYSSQANSFVLTDDNHQPLTPLILWPDRRVRELPSSLVRFWERDDFLSTTGVGIALSDQMAVAKLAALAKEPLWRRMRRVLTISDYLTFSLTGQFLGDAGTAVLLGLLDVAALCWWPPALQAAGVGEEHFSRPLRPGSLAGHLDVPGAQRLGLAPDTLFCVGSLDHHVAALGAGAGSLGELSISMGTVVACVRPGDAFRPAQGVIAGPGFEPDQFFQLAFCNEGAGMLEVYRDAYAAGCSIPDLLQQAASAPADGTGVRATLDAAAGRVDFEGGSGAASIAVQTRAVLEAVTEGAKCLLQGLCGSLQPQRVVVTGGGARSELWMQMLAERLGCEVLTTGCEEPACLGAAMLAARAAKWFDALSPAAAQWIQPRRRFCPR